MTKTTPGVEDVLCREYSDDVTIDEIEKHFNDLDYRSQLFEKIIITITFDLPKDLSFDKLYSESKRLNDIASSVYSQRPDFIMSKPYNLKYIFRRLNIDNTFEKDIVTYFYNGVYSTTISYSEHTLYKSNLYYNGPVKLSTISEKKISDFNVTDILYADSAGNLVSQHKDKDGNFNEPIAFYIGDGYFCSIRIMHPIKPTVGEIIVDGVFNPHIYYGFSSVQLSNKFKKPTNNTTYYYEKGLEILNNGQIEENWKRGPFISSTHQTKNNGLFSSLFNSCAVFKTNGTKRGDWFIPSSDLAVQIVNASSKIDFKGIASNEELYNNDYINEFEQLINIFEPTGYRFSDNYIYTSEDVSMKYSKVVNIKTMKIAKEHKLRNESHSGIIYAFACLNVID